MGAYDILATTNVMMIVDEIQDIRQYNRDFRWSDRIPTVPATDGEIMARYTGRINIADIIATDQVAVIRATNPLRMEQTVIPKIKHGAFINEEMMNVLARIEANLGGRQDVSVFRNYMALTMVDLIDGVRARAEALRMAMIFDSLSYDHWGIKISGITWLPAAVKTDLYVTAAVPWATAATATPITDIQTLQVTARQKYGKEYNRLSLPYTDFLNMVKTTEFKNLAQLYNNINFATVTPPPNDTELMRSLVGRILNLQIEIDDRQVQYENPDGSTTFLRYHTANKAVLSNTQDDGVSMTWDFANAILQETQPGVVPGIIGSFGSPAYGPIGYTTSANFQGNPPGLTMWAAQRGFPRKKELAANAVITTA